MRGRTSPPSSPSACRGRAPSLGPAMRTRKYFLARVLLGKSTTRPPEKPTRRADDVISSACSGPLGYSCSTARAPRTRQRYSVLKKRCYGDENVSGASQDDAERTTRALSLSLGSAPVLSALQSHWTAEMETAPSKLFGRTGRPWPRSPRSRSPSVSRSTATSSMSAEMSSPTLGRRGRVRHRLEGMHSCPSDGNGSCMGRASGAPPR